MSTKYSKALLMSGRDYALTPHITLAHPSIEDIMSINSSSFPDYTYWMYVQIILSDPYSNMVMLDDIGKNYMEMTPYDVFVIQWDNSIKKYEENKVMYDSLGSNPVNEMVKALQFFIKGNPIFYKTAYQDGSICFCDISNEKCQINREIYEYIYDWVKSINRIDYSDRIKPIDENARRILIEDMRDEIKKLKKQKKKSDDNMDYLGSLMSAAAFCGNGAISPYNILDCKIYWVNESLAINGKRSNAEHLLDAIHHGTIKSKDVNKKELNWIG